MLTPTTYTRRPTAVPGPVQQLWTANAPLTVTAAAMLVVLAGASVGLALDDRLVAGAPAWLKPAKFAVSIAIYTTTLAWVFTYLSGWVRTRRLAGWTTAVTLGLEIVIIVAQAWRGVPSHFNAATPLDGALFSVMGAAIGIQTLASIAVAVALWRQTFADRAIGWALRLGLTVTILGASTGGLMTQPTPAQVADLRAGVQVTMIGAHTVGAADGGPGLRGTGWSTAAGDLRVAHFVGLHALQVLPLIAVVLGRRRIPDVVRVRLVLSAAASYAGLFALLLLQALRGQSVIAPDAMSVALFSVWLAASTGAAIAAAGRLPRLTGAPGLA